MHSGVEYFLKILTKEFELRTRADTYSRLYMCIAKLYTMTRHLTNNLILPGTTGTSEIPCKANI